MAKIEIPDFYANIIVAETVVEPDFPPAIKNGKSLHEHFITSFSLVDKNLISSAFNPTMGLPFMMPIVAGTTPYRDTIAYTLNAV